jgi:hypothetical protein
LQANKLPSDFPRATITRKHPKGVFLMILLKICS